MVQNGKDAHAHHLDNECCAPVVSEMTYTVSSGTLNSSRPIPGRTRTSRRSIVQATSSVSSIETEQAGIRLLMTNKLHTRCRCSHISPWC